MSILRADSIRNRAGTGAPDFPNGATVTGVVTATSFSGNVTGNADTATSATSATSATNAQGLTGTPNITVGTVTGTDATFSGNLTVNGTTTTIDTAVTAVDSLAVDGSVGIGLTNPGSKLHVSGTTPTFRISHGTSQIAEIKADTSATTIRTTTNHPILLATNDTERLRITSGGAAIFKGGLAEKYNAVGGTLGSNTNNSIFNGNVIQFDGNESGNLTINFTAVHATLSQGENCSFTVLIRPNGSGVINAVQIDGQSPAGGLRWSGGSVPSAGAASSYDIYTFTIFKYGAANTNYRVFGAATNYA